MTASPRYEQLDQRIAALGSDARCVLVCCLSEHALGMFEAACGPVDGRKVVDSLWAAVRGGTYDLEADVCKRLESNVPRIDDDAHDLVADLGMKAGATILDAIEAIRSRGALEDTARVVLGIFDCVLTAELMRDPSGIVEEEWINLVEVKGGLPDAVQSEWSLLGETVLLLTFDNVLLDDLKWKHAERGRALKQAFGR